MIGQARLTILVMGLLQGRLAGRPAQKLTLPSTIILIISVSAASNIINIKSAVNLQVIKMVVIDRGQGSLHWYWAQTEPPCFIKIGIVILR